MAIKKELTKEERVNKEITRLRRIYKEMPKDTLLVVEGLIVEAADLRVRLEDVRKDLDENGYDEMFSQSENQEPYERERPAARRYIAMNKSYQTIMKQLGDYIPKKTVESKEKDDGISNAEDQLWIGGETASLYDTKQITERDEAVIIPVMISIIALLLLVYLRSIVAMIYLIVTVVLSFFSALGAGWLLLHYGMGAPAIQGAIPLYAFVFLVALGEDYNIFMVSEIWKNRKTQNHLDAVKNGVIQTGSVITSAGLILAGTFAVLGTLPIQVLVQFGIVTAIGVLLDTFIVRPLLVPAITVVLGRFAFWPGKLSRKSEEVQKVDA